MSRQLGGEIFDIGDEGSLLESVLREKLLKSMRSRLLVPEATSRAPERGLGTSTDNWMGNDAGATRQLISIAAVEEVHEEEGRVSDNHGEPMETQSEERGQAAIRTAAAMTTGEGRRDAQVAARDRAPTATQIVKIVRTEKQQLRQPRLQPANSGCGGRHGASVEGKLGMALATAAAATTAVTSAAVVESVLDAGRGSLADTGKRVVMIPKPANWSGMSKGQRQHWYKRNG
jgi:hypothetical protein